MPETPNLNWIELRLIEQYGILITELHEDPDNNYGPGDFVHASNLLRAIHESIPDLPRFELSGGEAHSVFDVGYRIHHSEDRQDYTKIMLVFFASTHHTVACYRNNHGTFEARHCKQCTGVDDVIEYIRDRFHQALALTTLKQEETNGTSPEERT